MTGCFWPDIYQAQKINFSKHYYYGECIQLMLKRTPLFEAHKRAGAKFVEFGGWEMPVQYSGLVDEHLTVREKAGLFDVSHMGEVTVKGPEALKFLQYVTSNNVAKLVDGKAQYSLLPNPQGGVVDDIIVYKIADNDYLLCVNAANTDKDFAWLEKNNTFDVELKNVSTDYGQIALQGPKAQSILAKLLNISESEVSKDNFAAFTFQITPITIGSDEVTVIVARTGYTGEDGFELFVPANSADALWEKLLEGGKDDGLKPIGLGARDSLRLEVCYPLHGHELSDEMLALSCGVGWVVKLKKGDFIGRDAMAKAKADGIKQKLVGLEVTDKGIIRHGTPLFDAEGNSLGIVASGTKPPCVGKAIGLAIVPTEFSDIGTEFFAEVRGKKLGVKVIETPFLRR